MAFATGISCVRPVLNEWTQFPDFDCDQIILEPGNYDLGDRLEPADVFFRMKRDLGYLTLRVPGKSGFLYVRSRDNNPISFIWSMT